MLIQSNGHVPCPTHTESNSQLDPDPEFIGFINNVTYPAGREAVLACSVRNLGKNKVGQSSQRRAEAALAVLKTIFRSIFDSAFSGWLAARLGSDCAGAAGTRGHTQCQDQCDASGYAYVSGGGEKEAGEGKRKGKLLENPRESRKQGDWVGQGE